MMFLVGSILVLVNSFQTAEKSFLSKIGGDDL